jgi:hypothetical protein
MLEVKQGKVAVEFSARQLSFGFERERSLLERNLPRVAEKYLPGSVRSARDDARLVNEAVRWSALAFAPAGLLALLGLLGIAARRFGRFLGALALLAGLGSIGTYVGLYYTIPFALQEAELKDVQVSLLLGAHLLTVVGVAGVIVGFGALARPDRGPRARARPPMPA